MSIPNFQEQLATDIDAVFFNIEAMEFAAKHTIGGIKGKPPVECDVVADHELYQERKVKDNFENASLDGIVVFIKKADWKKYFEVIPKVNMALKFDQRDYRIEAVDDDMGILELTLSGARG